MADTPEIAAAAGPPIVPRRRSVARAARREARRFATHDSYINLPARIGEGQDNLAAAGSYGFNPITRLRIILDWAYRGSWVCRMAVKAIPEDMFRAGIDIGSDIDVNDRDVLYRAYNSKHSIGAKLTEACTWGRLYGGAIAIIMVSGQRPETPLRLDTIGKGQFAGLEILDRWMVTPSLNDLVTDLDSKDRGRPKYYTVNADTPVLARQRVHHTRVIRFDGDDLPYYQRISENMWSLSVLEPIFDRIKAFDATTLGTAQMVFRAHLRTITIEKWREIVGAGGKRLEAALGALDWMRRFQTNEGLSVIDSTDRLESQTYSFTGLDAVLVQMGQQISGAIGVPLVRMFGQSPTGLNSTGESDWRNYYDNVNTRQERDARPGLERVLPVMARSEGIRLPDTFSFGFVPLWQLDAQQKSAVGAQNTGSVVSAHADGIVTRAMALKELKQQSRETGVWTNITDDDIKEAEEEPPMPGLEEPPAPQPTGDPEGPIAPTVEPPLDDYDEGLGDEADDFLPGARQRLRPRLRLVKPEDSGGGLQISEVERLERRHNGPMISLHRFADQDLPGRELTFAGFQVVVEVEAGQPRFQGSSGGAVMAAPYGYFPGTVGNDGDAVDVFLGPNEHASRAFVLHQQDPDSRKFHQHKVFLGFNTAAETVDVFRKFYADGRGGQRIRRGEEMSLDDFGKWLAQYRADRRTA